MKYFIVKASIIAMGLASFGVHASLHVKQLDFTLNYSADIHVKNVSGDTSPSEVELQVQESSIDIYADGFIECANDKDVRFKTDSAKIYFGPVSFVSHSTTINSSATLYQSSHPIGFKHRTWKAGTWFEEAIPKNQVFTVPLTAIKNGHPALRVNALAELNKKLQAYLQKGGQAIDFYKSDQKITLQRPISLSAACEGNAGSSKGNMGTQFQTRDYQITIRYEGDPNLTDEPAKPLVAVSVKAAGNEQSQLNNILPFKLDKATFQPNMPNYVGQCIPDKNPKLRMNFQMSGSEMGEIDVRVVGASNFGPQETYFETTGVVTNPKGGDSYLDFDFPLKELLAKNMYSYMAVSSNTTYNHSLHIQARYKNFTDGTWSEYKNFGGAQFKHRCTPQVAVELGGNGGKLGYQEGNNPKPGLYVQPITPSPNPVKPLGVQVPKPAPKSLDLQAPAPKPSPKPLRLKSK